MKDNFEELVIKKSGHHFALLGTSLIFGIPVLLLIEYPNFYLFIILLPFIIFSYIRIYRIIERKKPALILNKKQIITKDTTVLYTDIDFFQFIGYDERKPKINIHWWMGEIMILLIKTKEGKSIYIHIPNQLANAKELKAKIRSRFRKFLIEEKPERIRPLK